nr:DUF6807 family protein [Streptomyces sp. DSM 15324]
MAQAPEAPVVLRVAGRPVGRCVARPELPARLSPRPHLHPVTTLAGTQVTEQAPAGHLHHLGVGAAVPDAEGHTFWAERRGRTSRRPGPGRCTHLRPPPGPDRRRPPRPRRGDGTGQEGGEPVTADTTLDLLRFRDRAASFTEFRIRPL